MLSAPELFVRSDGLDSSACQLAISLRTVRSAYDANGNQLDKLVGGTSTRAIACDADNRPAGGATVTYLYGPDGERLKKIAGPSTTLYLGNDMERDPSGAWSSCLTPEVKLSGTTRTWLHRDHLSSVRAITSSTGAVTCAFAIRP